MREKNGRHEEGVAAGAASESTDCKQAAGGLHFLANFCGFCGWRELRVSEDGSLDCANCFREWGSGEAYLAEIEKSSLEFAIKNPGLRDGSGAKQAHFRGIARALIRRLPPADAETVALLVGRFGDFHDATSRALLAEAAAEETARLRALRGVA